MGVPPLTIGGQEKAAVDTAKILKDDYDIKLVLSSDYEGISNSLLEALSMGLSCILTDCLCGGSRMLIEDGVFGVLTPFGDEVAFYNAMKKIAEDGVLHLRFLPTR